MDLKERDQHIIDYAFYVEEVLGAKSNFGLNFLTDDLFILDFQFDELYQGGFRIINTLDSILTVDKKDKEIHPSVKRIKYLFDKTKDLIENGKYADASIYFDKVFSIDYFQSLYDSFKSEKIGIELSELHNVFTRAHGISEYGFNDKRYKESVEDLCRLYNKENNVEHDKMTLYRGICSNSDARGMSWTTAPNIAEWFSKRFNSNEKEAHVLICEVPSDYILHVFSGSSEKEVLVSPSIYQDGIKIEYEKKEYK